ncbi:MAG: AAA family ATPase, partial [Chloroflexi bacterium]|nr:AAA family ATPase [Chloroflexota bacterium]
MNKAHCHRLILRLFGYPQAELDGVPVRLARRKSWALLAYISLASTEIGRDTFAALLWPDYEGEQAFAYVRQSLWELNKALQGAIQSEGQKILISSEVERWVDVLHFQEILKRWQTRRSREALCLLEEAMALYRADFLAGFTLRDSPAFDDWQLSQAEVLRRQLGEVLTSLTEEYTAQGDLDMAIASIQRWLAMDPLDEARHRDLMRLYAWAGQRSAAIRQYESCAARLRSELRAAPEAATKELLEQIRSGAIRPPVKPMPAAPIPEIASRAPDSTLITPFAGREAELVQLKELLAQPECRLVTLVGPGGIGKTRLAREFAATYPHESVWVSLTTSSSAEQLVSVLADALSLTFRPVTDARPALEQELAQLAGHMRDRNLLLVLDNMEQLADVSPLLSNLLVKAPGIKMLATSRERLGLPEEWVFSVSGLPCPTIRAEESILCTAAVELFTRCAQRARADLAWQEEDWPALARICQLVEGMPLAIELAAAWVSVLSLQEIVAELEQGPDLLVSRQRGIAPRHASLRAVFEHSWGLLTERERVAFAQLSIFQGGFTRSAAAQVSLTPLETLSTLVDKSLLRRDTTGRYSIHPVLRQYAEEALRQMPAVRTEIGERHRTYNLDLLEAEG